VDSQILEKANQRDEQVVFRFVRRNMCDGSQDDKISCFKEGKPSSDGRAMLKEQLEFMNKAEQNPFVPDDDYVTQAALEELLVDNDEECDIL